ncbi:ABC-three component system middle component 2 [Sphingobium sp. EP60837]|uniref:ABC-three component system middle component 2 n=1 Tax=Sphingobium sp. EP60837 TaxID=1855519 RepID=UPI0007DD8CF1|nr:ABC-three component system middle component 2 [Sphingobium sp. EP60837]ANI80321.1 hypothetical protein EP837_03943 [Sphingobium sp. EP60837]
MTQATPITLFNSPLETGVRSVLILNAADFRAFDLTHLTWLDHLVVHTSDIGGPRSLHPDIPQRDGELIVRRRNVEDGLRLMRRLQLVTTDYTSEGILYRITEDGAQFSQLVRSDYGRRLKDRAIWLMDYVGRIDGAEFVRMISEKIGRWSIEFQSEGNVSNGS